MGDRANIVIRSEWPDDIGPKEAVFLYGHWSGYDLPEVLREGLERGRPRWTDAQYLARILFESMVGESAGGETGYGISSRLMDNEYDLLVLLPAEQRLVRLREDDYRAHGFEAIEDQPSIGFEDYVSAEQRTWDNLTDANATVS